MPPAPQAATRRAGSFALHCRDGSGPATQRRLLASASLSAAAPRLEDEVLDLRFAPSNLTGSPTTSNPFHAGQIFKCTGPFMSTGCPDGQFKPISATALGQVDIWLFLIATFHSLISGGWGCQRPCKARLLPAELPTAACQQCLRCMLQH